MIAFFLTMPIRSTMPMTPMMSSPAPAALSVNSAPMPADGSVVRIVIGWMKLS